MFNLRRLAIVVTSLAFTAVAVPANAALITDLIANDGSITDGDKVFSDFFCDVTGSGNFAGGCDSINVQPLSSVLPGELGLSFQDIFIVSEGPSTLDVLIGYTVTVTDPKQEIEAVSLVFNGETFGSLAIATVTETVFDPNTNAPIGQLSVINSANPNVPTVLSVVIPLDYTVSSARVLKDIGLVSFAGGGDATISFIGQDFRQTTVVPEPATLAVLGIGLAGLGFAVRRRRYA